MAVAVVGRQLVQGKQRGIEAEGQRGIEIERQRGIEADAPTKVMISNKDTTGVVNTDASRVLEFSG